MKTEEKHLAAGGGEAAEEPLFTEEAEEEARPVVPLGRLDDGGPASRRTRGRLPRSFLLVLALIAAGAAGATAALLAHMGRASHPAVEATANVAPEPDTPQTAVSNIKETSMAGKSDAHARPESRAQFEPERPQTDKVDVRGRDAEERAERARDEEESRRDEEQARAERRRGGDEMRQGREENEKRAERRVEEKSGKPKARLVGTITERPRPY